MATTIRTQQSAAETRTHTVTFEEDLLSGVTISTVALRHTGPSTETPTSAITSPNVAVTLTTPAVGQHRIEVAATLSNSEVIEALLIIEVGH